MADDNTFSSEKGWKNVQSSRSKTPKWDDNSGVNQDRADALQAGVNKSIGDTLSEAWDNIKKIPSDIEKGLNKKSK